MKKAVLAILVFSLLVALCACGGKDTAPVETTQPTTMAPETTAPTTEPSEEPTEPSEEPTEPSVEPTEPTKPSHTHAYTEAVTKQATCSAAGEKTFTCACGDSYTEAISKTAHDFYAATCTAPKTCKTCKSTEGKALGHNYSGKTCSRCGSANPDYKAITDGAWAYMADHGCIITFSPNGDWNAEIYHSVITYEEYESLGEGDKYYYTTIEVNGVEYAYAWPIATSNYGSYTVDNDTVTINISLYVFETVDGKEEMVLTDVPIVLDRIAGNKFKVQSVSAYAEDSSLKNIKVGDVFTFVME
jgi:predicted small lipoprotein YifL